VVEVRTFAFEDDGFVPWAQCDDTPDGFGGRRRAWSFFVNDPSGAPDELVAGDGAVVALFDRKAWGKAHVVRGQAYSPLRYQGQYADEDTGLHYNRHRYYDPATGLYLSPDPIGLDGGLRPYGYGSNPTGWIDPLGLTHYARVKVIRGGEVVFEKDYDSANMTPEEKALGFPQSMKAAHTEARACREVTLLPGDIMHIHGARPPCDPCQGAMNKLYRDMNGTARIVYTNDAGEAWDPRKKQMKRWEAGTWEANGGRGWKPK
jgi:RHS repeat-associated protein